MNASGQTICLSMIVKNERHVIRRCLQSVRPIIDYWIIVDTGSNDGTQQEIRDVLKDVPGELVERQWIDFGFNRTEALQLARPHGDYSLVIDADDTLELADGYRLPLLEADSYHIDILRRDGDVSFQRTQLLRNSLEWRYRGVLHEFPDCQDAKTSGYLPIVMRDNHEGARSTALDTYVKDAEIIERAIAHESDAFMLSRYYFYLGQSYFDAGRPEKALPAYQKRASLDFWSEEVFFSLLRAGLVQEELGYAPDDVLRSFERANVAAPGRAEALHAGAKLCRQHERFEEGFALASRAISLSPPPNGLFVSKWVYDYGCLDEYAVCAYWTGRYRECLDATLTALERGNVPASEQPRLLQNMRFALDRL